MPSFTTYKIFRPSAVSFVKKRLLQPKNNSFIGISFCNFFVLFTNLRIKKFLRENGLPKSFKVREWKTGNVISSTISVRQSAKRIKHQGTALNEDPITGSVMANCFLISYER